MVSPTLRLPAPRHQDDAEYVDTGASRVEAGYSPKDAGSVSPRLRYQHYKRVTSHRLQNAKVDPNGTAVAAVQRSTAMCYVYFGITP
jgi:hypothetical protein